MVQNIVLPFWKLLAYVCQMIIFETLVCLMLTLKGRNCPPAQCALEENAIDGDSDVFSGCLVGILYFYYFIQKPHSKPLIL
jgi:hypothetical protein